ncbi:MAG: hypothetical protein HS111_08055 [Kofleriaceae bacterium]|nr:hypothetical protein [Kofleriaceae bacterium]MCL4223705.1 hypothetical protein [Myxococcales bacterium]
MPGRAAFDRSLARVTASAALLLALAATGCAAQRGEGPLDVALGLSRSETARALRHHDFCPRLEAATEEEVYPRCDRPGAGFGAAWVVARYDGGRLVRLQRFERWTDEARAAERWNLLIEKRAARTPVSQEARARLLARQPIPDGTRSWAAFRAGDDLVGVYLLRPATADGPSILEEILPAR